MWFAQLGDLRNWENRSRQAPIKTYSFLYLRVASASDDRLGEYENLLSEDGDDSSIILIQSSLSLRSSLLVARNREPAGSKSHWYFNQKHPSSYPAMFRTKEECPVRWAPASYRIWMRVMYEYYRFRTAASQDHWWCVPMLWFSPEIYKKMISCVIQDRKWKSSQWFTIVSERALYMLSGSG